MVLMGFISLDEFRQRKLCLGEAFSMYVHNFKKLLDQAMPGLDKTARKQLLLHQFLAGLQEAVSCQLRAIGEKKDFNVVIEWTRLLLTLNEQDASYKAAAIKDNTDEVGQLKEQITKLMGQDTALSASSQKGATDY